VAKHWKENEKEAVEMGMPSAILLFSGSMIWSGRAVVFLPVQVMLPPSESHVCWSFNSKAVDIDVCCGGMRGMSRKAAARLSRYRSILARMIILACDGAFYKRYC